MKFISQSKTKKIFSKIIVLLIIAIIFNSQCIEAANTIKLNQIAFQSKAVNLSNKNNSYSSTNIFTSNTNALQFQKKIIKKQRLNNDSHDIKSIKRVRARKVPEGNVLVFSNINYTGYTTLYNKNDINELLDSLYAKSQVSLKVGKNTTLIIYSKESKTTSYIEADSMIASFPKEDISEIKELDIITKGEVIIFPSKNMKGKYVKIKQKSKENIDDSDLMDNELIDYSDRERNEAISEKLKTRIEFSNKNEKKIIIKSYIIASNTVLMIEVKNSDGNSNNESSIQIKDNYYLINSSSYNSQINEEIVSIKVQEIEDNVLPEPKSHCILAYPFSHFRLKNRNEEIEGISRTICSDIPNTVYTASIKKMAELSEEKICDRCIKSVLAGNHVQPVLFNKENYEGTGFPIPNKIFSFENTILHNKVKSIFILKENCVMLFTEILYSGSNFTFCSSIDNLSKASLNSNFSSIIVGRNTIIELFSEVGFKGKGHFILNNEDKSLSIISNIKSMKIHNSNNKNEIILNNEKKKLHNCALLFKEKSFQSDSALFCQSNIVPSKYDFNSIEIPENSVVVIYLNSITSDKDIENKASRVKTLIITESQDLPEEIDFRAQIKIDIVETNCVILFEKSEYEGDSVKLCHSTPNIKDEIQNKVDFQIKSIIVGKITDITLYKYTDFRENTEEKDETSEEKEEDEENNLKIITKESISKLAIEPKSLRINSIERKNDELIFDSNDALINFNLGVLLGLLYGSDHDNNDNTLNIKKKLNQIQKCNDTNKKENRKKRDNDKDNKREKKGSEEQDKDVRILVSNFESSTKTIVNVVTKTKDFSQGIQKLIGKKAEANNKDLKVNNEDKQRKSNTNKTAKPTVFNFGIKYMNTYCNFRSTIQKTIGLIFQGISIYKDYRSFVAKQKINTATTSNKVSAISQFILNYILESSKNTEDQKTTEETRKARKLRRKDSRKIRKLRKIFGFLVEKARKYTSNIKNGLTAVKSFFTEKAKEVFMVFIIKFLTYITNKLKEQYQNIKRFFLYIYKIINFIKCSVKHISPDAVKLVNSLNDILTPLTNTNVPNVVLNILVTDLFFGQFCDSVLFRSAFDYFSLGKKIEKENESNKVKSRVYFGIGVGFILKVFAQSNSPIDRVFDLTRAVKSTFTSVRNFFKA